MLFQKLLQKVVREGNLRLIDAKGKIYDCGDGSGPRCTMRIHKRLLEYKLALNPPLYLGEAYMDGDVTLEESSLRDIPENTLQRRRRALVQLGFRHRQRPAPTGRAMARPGGRLRRRRHLPPRHLRHMRWPFLDRRRWHTIPPSVRRRRRWRHTIPPSLGRRRRRWHTIPPSIRRRRRWLHTIPPSLGRRWRRRHTIPPSLGRRWWWNGPARPHTLLVAERCVVPWPKTAKRAARRRFPDVKSHFCLCILPPALPRHSSPFGAAVTRLGHTHHCNTRLLESAPPLARPG